MKKKMLSISIFLCSVFILLAQEPIVTAKVNLDSVLLGNKISVRFVIENVPNAELEAPDFVGFNLAGGPNYASSMSMINGDVTQSVTYTYWLEPKDVGQIWIPSAQVKIGDKIIESEPIEINVYHNPDGIIQKPSRERRMDSWFSWPEREVIPKKKDGKKKRKVYRI